MSVGALKPAAANNAEIAVVRPRHGVNVLGWKGEGVVSGDAMPHLALDHSGPGLMATCRVAKTGDAPLKPLGAPDNAV